MFNGTADMPKNLSLPGFPNCERCQLHTLQYKYDWTEQQLEWVRKNWINEKNDIYVKPGCKDSSTGTLKDSNEETMPLLQIMLKNVNIHTPEEYSTFNIPNCGKCADFAYQLYFPFKTMVKNPM